MPSGLNMDTFAAALKQHYTDDRVKNLVYRNNPLLAAMPKMERFGGKNLPIPIQYGNPASRSATFADAQNASTAASSLYKDFVLTRVKDYCIATISTEAMEASIGNPNAFMEASAREIDSALMSCTRSLATALFRDGSGFIGNAGAAVAGPPGVITLNNIQNVVNFEVGMQIEGEVGGVHHAGGTITGVNRDNGELTFAAGIGAIVAGDDLYILGDRLAGGGPGLKLSGLSAWVPDAAPGAAAFFGVDRTADSTRLGGVRVAGGGGANKVERLTKASARLAREGGRPTHCFMSYEDYGELLEELNQKVRYTEIEAYERGDISFAGCLVHTPSGAVVATPDVNCPTGKAYLLQMDTWKLYSLGGAPRIIDSDGNRLLRQTSADGVEVRIGYYAQLGCNAPGWNCVITAF